MKCVKLTAMQEEFVRGVFEGKTQYQAYIDAGYSTKNKDRAYIDTRASELARNSKVIARLKELSDEYERELIRLKASKKRKLLLRYEWLQTSMMKEIHEQGANRTNTNALLKSMERVETLLGLSETDTLKNEKLRQELYQKDDTDDKLDKMIDALNEVLENEA